MDHKKDNTVLNAQIKTQDNMEKRMLLNNSAGYHDT